MKYAFIEAHPGLAETVAEVALSRASQFEFDEGSAAVVAETYGLGVSDALAWMTQVQWTAPGTALDDEMLASVKDRMRSLGRIT